MGQVDALTARTTVLALFPRFALPHQPRRISPDLLRIRITNPNTPHCDISAPPPPTAAAANSEEPPRWAAVRAPHLFCSRGEAKRSGVSHTQPLRPHSGSPNIRGATPGCRCSQTNHQSAAQKVKETCTHNAADRDPPLSRVSSYLAKAAPPRHE